MFIYENEGFIEAEAKDIQRLCRSLTAVSFGPEDEKRHDLQVSLCEYLDQGVPQCRVAFYAKTLKRSFVFAVKGSEQQSSWQLGFDLLDRLGFKLSTVNLNLGLSPAMQEVLLRDVPGLATPECARNFRADHARFLDGLMADYEKAPESAPGKKASLRLATQDRLNKRAGEVRQFLAELLSPPENLAADLDVLQDQVRDLTARLEAADDLAKQESKQREMSEAITSAAEKRIRELEEILVDVDTKTNNIQTLKFKNIQLQGHIDELGSRFASVNEDLVRERDKQGQFIADVMMAHQQISSLQESLRQATQALEELQAFRTEAESERMKATESLKEAEMRIKTLDAKLQKFEKRSIQYDEILKEKEVMSTRLSAVQEELNESLALNQKLQGEFACVVSRCDESERRLRVAEENCRLQNLNREPLAPLAAKNQELTSALEEVLSSQKKMPSQLSLTDTESEGSAAAVVLLRSDLQEKLRLLALEQAARQGLESELDEAHKMVDSLEKILRETALSAGGARGENPLKTSDNQQVQELELKLKALEQQLELERLEQKQLAKAVVDAEKKVADQEELLLKAGTNQTQKGVVAPSLKEITVAVSTSAAKQLPHELRPIPKKGAPFHPDWDLHGLPCGSVKQVDKAWETVFNVQLSLEGYPSQYCMAFLVVLRLDKQKKVFLLYRLKLDKHTLVCIPAKIPTDDASLKKTIREGLKFLQLSGFQMDEMSSDNIESTLGPYFLEA